MANLIMPHRRGKIKEETMNLQDELLDLDATVNQISRGVSAVVMMAKGLDETRYPYVDGFDVVSDYLVKAVHTLREQTDRCLQAV